MPLLKDGAVQPDRWTYLAEDEYPAVGQPVIIDYDRWRDGDAAIAAQGRPDLDGYAVGAGSAAGAVRHPEGAAALRLA